MSKTGKETARTLEAFEYYYLLGTDRSLKKVAEKFNVSVTTVTNWSSKYDWVHRVRLRDERNFKLIQEADDKAYIDSMRQYKKLINASMANFVRALQAQTVVVNTVKDFDKLVRLDLDISDRLLINDENKIALHQKESGDSSLSGILNCIRGEMEGSTKDSSDKSSSGFSSVKDLTDDEEED